TCKVRKFRTVDANNRTVIVPKPRPTLTVTTCYPFRYIVDALERYIITADLIESKKEKGIRRAAWQSFFLW
ncbi:sortase, partial [Butyricicoccus sp. 1XD8-22]